MSLKKILIAEDEAFLKKVMRVTLELKGYKIDEVANGADALEKIKKNQYDLILLDLIMPKMNGFEVLEEMKALKNKTPVLVFSNLSQESDRKEALALGAKGFYIKSDMPLNELVGIVERNLKK